MKKLLFLFILTLSPMLASAQTASDVQYSGSSDYLPFVNMGKQWNVVSTVVNSNSSCHFERYRISEETERNGKTYFKVLRSEDDLSVMHNAGLYREENRRVYKYDEMAGRDVMLYDFSLKEGDTFTYEIGIGNSVNCKVLKQGWLNDGPMVVLPYNSSDTLYSNRHLRTWTIGRDNGSGVYDEITTWVECVGALENMFSPFTSGESYRLAYIDYHSDMWDKNSYLPFSICDIYDVRGQIHGLKRIREVTGMSSLLTNWKATVYMSMDKYLVHAVTPMFISERSQLMIH